MKMSKTLTSSTTTKIKLAAKKLFAAKGFDAVTVAEIGKKSRANPALINYHFGSKKELYYSIIEDFTNTGRDFARALLRTPSDSQSFLENLDLYIRHLLKRYLDDPELHLLLNRECEVAMNQQSSARFENQILEVFKLLEEFYSKAKAHGLLEPSTNPRTITLMLFCTLSMLCQRNSLHAKFIGVSLDDPNDFETVASTLLQLYGRNLLLKRL